MITIPQISIEMFEDIYIEHILDLYRINKEQLVEKVSGLSSSSLNRRAEMYIKTYLLNKIDNLDPDNWQAAKELYIQWKLFEEIELEEVSKDKKETLHEMLELFRWGIKREDDKNSAGTSKGNAKFF
ncbi:MAG: hypothetical protein ACRCTS_01620 [Fusobacteriaceae bacterium]